MSQRSFSGRCFHGGMAPRPLEIFQKSSPSDSLATFADVQSAGFGGGSAAAAGPSPLPLPWQDWQFVSIFFFALPSACLSVFLSARGFFIALTSAGAFHSPCAHTAETAPTATRAAAVTTINDLWHALMGSPLRTL